MLKLTLLALFVSYQAHAAPFHGKPSKGSKSEWKFDKIDPFHFASLGIGFDFLFSHGIDVNLGWYSPQASSGGDSNQQVAATSTVSASSSSTQTSTQLLNPSDAPLNNVPNSAYGDVAAKFQLRFWNNENQQWNQDDQACGSNFSETVVWTQAQTARAIINTGDSDNIDLTMSQFDHYYNSDVKAYSASTAKDDDIYNDDNAQVAWAFIEAYEADEREDYLDSAKSLVDYLLTQWDNQYGGVIWRRSGSYIASISTVEAGLAALKLYDHTHNEKYLDFAKNCTNFMFDTFQDTDHLFFDGFGDGGPSQMNKGKLTYTAGCVLSSCAYLYKYTADNSWINKAVSVGKAAMSLNSPFYDKNGFWNNDIVYVQLLFTGYADLLSMGPGNSAFSSFKKEFFRQGKYIYTYLQDNEDSPLFYESIALSTQNVYNKYSKYFSLGSDYQVNKGLYCGNNESNHHKKSLMINACASHLLYQINRLS